MSVYTCLVFLLPTPSLLWVYLSSQCFTTSRRVDILFRLCMRKCVQVRAYVGLLLLITTLDTHCYMRYGSSPNVLGVQRKTDPSPSFSPAWHVDSTDYSVRVYECEYHCQCLCMCLRYLVFSLLAFLLFLVDLLRQCFTSSQGSRQFCLGLGACVRPRLYAY